jgi:hypothetical protein
VCATALGWLVAVALPAEMRFHSPAPGARLSAGETVTATWSVPCDRSGADETELVLSLDGGITFPIRASRSLPPCAASYAWRVPEVATRNARLGLREGREGRSETERIVLVSGPFSIVQTGGSPASDLTRGAIEWWTDQALFDVAAEDWLGASLGRPPTCRAGAESEPDADEPGPESSSSPHPERERLRAAAPAIRGAAARPTVPRLPAPVPLRV